MGSKDKMQGLLATRKIAQKAGLTIELLTYFGCGVIGAETSDGFGESDHVVAVGGNGASRRQQVFFRPNGRLYLLFFIIFTIIG